MIKFVMNNLYGRQKYKNAVDQVRLFICWIMLPGDLRLKFRITGISRKQDAPSHKTMVLKVSIFHACKTMV